MLRPRRKLWMEIKSRSNDKEENTGNHWFLSGKLSAGAMIKRKTPEIIAAPVAARADSEF